MCCLFQVRKKRPICRWCRRCRGCRRLPRAHLRSFAPPPRNSHGIAIYVIYPACVCIYNAREIKATIASPKIDCFQTKVFRALKQCVSERVPSWSSRCCSSRPTGCCGVAILWICAPIDLPKPRRQPFCVQVRHLSLSSSCSCRQDKSLDFLWCGQEEGEVARNRAS